MRIYGMEREATMYSWIPQAIYKSSRLKLAVRNRPKGFIQTKTKTTSSEAKADYLETEGWDTCNEVVGMQ